MGGGAGGGGKGRDIKERDKNLKNILWGKETSRWIDIRDVRLKSNYKNIKMHSWRFSLTSSNERPKAEIRN